MESREVTSNDTLVTKVETAAARYRKSGSVHDLIDLRDTRISAGNSISDNTDTAWCGYDTKSIPQDVAPPRSGTLPEIDLRDLSIATLRGAMHHHGALIVRNFFSPRLAHEYRQKIDTVLAEAHALEEATAAGDLSERSANSKAWVTPANTNENTDREGGRIMLKRSGSIRTFMSPRVSQNLFDDFERLGLRSLLQAYFGDEPCLSVNKSVLRRAEPLALPADWHQDGAFMGDHIQSLNLWVALTECGAGTDSPGMDLIPERLTSILKTGENGAIFNWSLSGKTVSEEFSKTAAVQPRFSAGDAVFFDHFNLHATSFGPEFTRTRYAIENWFFAKSRAPLNQQPAFW